MLQLSIFTREKSSCHAALDLRFSSGMIQSTTHSSTRMTHRKSNSVASLNCFAASSVIVMIVFDVFGITSIYGTKLCDFEEFGDANTVLHSCVFGIVLTLRQKTVLDDRRGTALDAAADGALSGTLRLSTAQYCRTALR
jgi:hypothetical protein